MAVRNPDETIRWSIALDGSTFAADLPRGMILHQAFHRLLPEDAVRGRRLSFRTADGTPVYADNFLGDIVDHLGTTTVIAHSDPIEASTGRWMNVGIDHLAITVADRDDAVSFFTDVIGLQCVRHDAHLSCLTTGPTTVMLFDPTPDAPLGTSQLSTWHHLGFVVDDLAAAYHHLLEHGGRLSSDFAMLERDERWSLYFFYDNGPVRFMFQFSEIKPEHRGMVDPVRERFGTYLYDYAKKPYGVDWELAGFEAMAGERVEGATR